MNKIETIILLIFIIILSVKHTTYGQETVITIQNENIERTLTTSIEKAWQSLLLTIAQEQLKVNNIILDEYRIITDYKIVSNGNLVDSLFMKRETFMTGFDGSLAVWKQLRYRYDIQLNPLSDDRTAINIKLTGGRRETNTTNVWHPYLSTGSFEEMLLSKIENNINLIEINSIDALSTEFDLLCGTTAPFSAASKSIKCEYNYAFSILQKVLKNNSFSIKYFSKKLGIIITDEIDLGNEDINLYMTLCCSLKQDELNPSEQMLNMKAYMKSDEENSQNISLTGESSKEFASNILENVESALQYAGEFDKYDFTFLNTSEVKTTNFHRSLSDVWFSVIRVLDQLEFNVAELYVDTVLVAVTDYKIIDNKYNAFQILISPDTGDTHKVLISTTCRRDNPNEWFSKADFCYTNGSLISKFHEKLSECLDNPQKSVVEHTSHLNEEAKMYLSGSMKSNLIDEILAISFKRNILKEIEIYPKGICYESDSNQVRFVIPVYITEPLKSETELDHNKLINTMIQKVVYPFGFALTQGFTELPSVDLFQFDIAYKYYNLDDKTLLDYSFRYFNLIVDTEDLFNFNKTTLDIKSLVKNSRILNDGNILNTDNFRLSTNTY